MEHLEKFFQLFSPLGIIAEKSLGTTFAPQPLNRCVPTLNRLACDRTILGVVLQQRTMPRQNQAQKQRQRENAIQAKFVAFTVLGDKCVHCGFSDVRALQIDHRFGGGREDKLRSRNYYFYLWVAKNPEAFQLLCANCNWIKRAERREGTAQVYTRPLDFAGVQELVRRKQQLRNATAAEAGFPGGLDDEDDKFFEKMVGEHYSH